MTAPPSPTSPAPQSDEPAHVHAAINIFSGETGLGGALTNPTELARQKGCIVQAYPVTFAGRAWPDVETAYHVLAADDRDEAARDALLVELIAAKFRQHPRLHEAVRERGGREWLMRCTHFTQARTARAQSWEGAGVQSRFIRNLVAGYDAAAGPAVEHGQRALF